MLHAFSTFVFLAQSTDPSALEEKTPLRARSAERPGERCSPALLSWGDFDGDLRLDLAAVGVEGALQILANAAKGRFEDVSEQVGLSGIGNAALALWTDYDADGRLDLFVGAREGASRLFHNDGGVFVDMSDGTGLRIVGAVRSAHWLDHDGDGRLDLHVVTAEGNELFRGLEGGFFERSELPALAGAGEGAVPGGPTVGASSPAPTLTGDLREEGMRRGASAEGSGVVSPTSSPSPIVVQPRSGTSGTSSIDMIASCLPAIRDQANPGACLQASTTPTLGRLYPLSANLFVALGGDVGIGTTSPSAKLHVAGTARVTDTLTLAPSGDQALDVSTGSIYKAGQLFIHTKGAGLFETNTAVGRAALTNVTSGAQNTAIGGGALYFNTTGYSNTASGFVALNFNTTGRRNTASGSYALRSNTTGYSNSASGASTLQSNTTGSSNSASGDSALRMNTTGYRNTAFGTSALRSNTTGIRNTAVGARALYSNSTGLRNTACGYGALSSSTATGNIALGFGAGQFLTTGNDNITIGHYGVAGEQTTIRLGSPGSHFRTFIAGIRGATTGIANAIPVLVDSNGQLGTISSSARFKEEIRDMGELTERLLQLRPVVFRYKPEVQEGERPLEYGLIAEEVAEVFPELVVHDEEGKPFTVKYHLLSSMLLNELTKLHDRLESQGEAHERELEELRGEVTHLRAHELRLAALEDQVFGGESSLPNRRRP